MKSFVQHNGYPPIKSGTLVRARIKRGRKNDYNTAGTSLRERHDGQVGLVWDFSDAHGLCYGVAFEDGEIAYFDPDELVNE